MENDQSIISVSFQSKGVCFGSHTYSPDGNDGHCNSEVQEGAQAICYCTLGNNFCRIITAYSPYRYIILTPISVSPSFCGIYCRSTKIL